MQTLRKHILMAAAIVIGTSGLTAQTNTSWFEQWHKAKFGRNSVKEEARQRAEQANTAYRADPSVGVAASDTWFSDQRYRTKYGRSSPIEESRQKAEQANTAYRAEPSVQTLEQTNDWFLDQRHRAKFGRPRP
jgi:hypothetical protein